MILISLYILVLQINKLYSYMSMLKVLNVDQVPIKTTIACLIISIIMYIHIVLIGIDIYSMKVLMEEKTVYSIDFSLIFFALATLITSLSLMHYTYYRFYLIPLGWHNVLLVFLLHLVVPFNTFLKKVLHFLILLLTFYVFCNLTLITTHWVSIIETCHKSQTLNISPDSNKLELLYNFINRGIKTDIRTFKLFNKINQLQQEFLPTYQYKEISMRTTDYSPLTLLSIILLAAYVYIIFLQQVIIF